MTSSTAPCPNTDRIEAFLDGDFGPDETDTFVAHLDACASCDHELTLALRLQDSLSALTPSRCPDDVFQSALDRIAVLDQDRAPVARPRTARRRWVAGALCTAVAALLIALPILDRAAEPAFTQAEVESATRDVELAFALLAEASHTATERVRNDAFGRSAAQINHALTRSR